MRERPSPRPTATQRSIVSEGREVALTRRSRTSPIGLDPLFLSCCSTALEGVTGPECLPTAPGTVDGAREQGVEVLLELGQATFTIGADEMIMVAHAHETVQLDATTRRAQK
jgi:hypothetical protein